ncbi:MAG: division/cell wall cluster transcriptional repressor MraZ [Candidatus Omnitrophica bacterium]|nr:division/cell wall cluster transcriptional repressor MraZ [Candidatus Omnitrophota bacterium]
MFYGEYDHTLDKKGRLILPSKIREMAKANYVEKFYVTRGLDTCLFLFAEDEWRSQETKFKSLSFTKREARHFNRLFFSGAVEVVPDGQGRVLLPKYLKDYAGIKKDVVITGVSNRIEIWDKDKWNKFYDDNKDSFEDTAEKLIDL